MQTEYGKVISSMSKEALEEEEYKLVNVLNNLCQAHKDREETIHLVLMQLEQVRNLKAFKYEEQTGF
jgi:hypothetical protein